MVASKVDVWNLALGKIGSTDFVEAEDDDSTEAAVCSRHFSNCLREMLESRHWAWATQQVPLTEITEQSATTAYADVVDTNKKIIPFSFSYRDTSQIVVQKIAVSGAETTLVAGADYTITEADPDTGVGASISLVAALTAGQSIEITVTTSRTEWDHLYSLPSDFVAPIGLLYSGLKFADLQTDSRVPFAIMPNDAGDGLMLACDFDTDDVDGLEYVAYTDNVAVMPAHFVTALAWRLAIELALAIVKKPDVAAYCRNEYDRAVAEALAQQMNANYSGPEPLTPSRFARG